MTFPLSGIPLDATPDDTWATCGTCNRTFPDIYPAARCPFEGDHEPEDEPEEAGEIGDIYALEVKTIVAMFEYEFCELCGGGLNTHAIGPDPFGHAHLYCLTGEEAAQWPPVPRASGDHGGARRGAGAGRLHAQAGVLH